MALWSSLTLSTVLVLVTVLLLAGMKSVCFDGVWRPVGPATLGGPLGPLGPVDPAGPVGIIGPVGRVGPAAFAGPENLGGTSGSTGALMSPSSSSFFSPLFSSSFS